MKISLKTAQAAKKAGYKQQGGFIMRKCRYSDKKNPRYDIYTTQDDAKTWLRQIKNIHLNPDYFTNEAGNRVWAFTAIDLINMKYIHISGESNSYEKALETALRDSFNNLKEWTYNMMKR